MKIYIRSTTCISPQKTFNATGFLIDIVEYNQIRLNVIEPDYKTFIDPKLARRMSHVIKMGVTAARQCLIDGNCDMPGAIITGTAYGCLEDTVTFLTRMIELEEELLPPTAFIQSTHNTVAAQIALMLRCHSYNTTFVHKGVSFENALLDAMMLLNEQEADNILLGGTEELTDTSFTVLTRLGLYKHRPVGNLNLFTDNTRGTIAGEGASFFLLTDKASAENLAEIVGIKTLYRPKSTYEIEQGIISFLASHGLGIGDIDLVITGKNGDTRYDAIYHELKASLFKDTAIANFKHLSGEYPTSVGFALWMAANIVKRGAVPKLALEVDEQISAPKKILIYNHYQMTYHSLMLVTDC